MEQIPLWTELDEFFATELSNNLQLIHYTDANGLLGILKKQEIWATDASCLSDRQELLYAKELIADHLETLCRHQNWNPDFKITSEETDQLINYVDRLRALQTRVSDVFVASFSAAYDSLSQWREYGGYSVNLSGAALQGCAQLAGGFLAKCVYQERDQMRLVRRFVRVIIEAYRQHSDGSLLRRDIGDYTLLRLGALLKHPSFEEEAEWRIVIPTVPELGRLEFRQSNQMIVPYVRVNIVDALKAEVGAPKMPQVGLGPGSERVSEGTVRRLATKTIGTNVNVYVHRSDAPYERGRVS